MHVSGHTLAKFGAWIAPLLVCVACSQGTLDLAVLNRVVPNPVYPHVAIQIPDYCPADGQTVRGFYALNASAKVKGGTLLEDYDRDGVPNSFEGNPLTGTDYQHADTNGDGYGDLLMVVLGIPVQSQAALAPCLNPALDSDGDGLNDCEEALLGTDPKNPDTDGDGIPDYLELRFGLNPLDGTDGFQDPDGDGLSNLEEVRRNTPPTEFNDALTKGFEYQYDQTPVTVDGKNCYRETVSNITMSNVPNGNLLRFFFLEADALGHLSMRNGKALIPVGTPDGTRLVRKFSELSQ